MLAIIIIIQNCLIYYNDVFIILIYNILIVGKLNINY